MKLIEGLTWRYATKKFDPAQTVGEAELSLIREAVRLTASSYGFQPYKVLEITSPELRQRLQPASWGQAQVVDASHLFVFCSYDQFTDEMVDTYLSRKGAVQGLSAEKLKGYGKFMKGKMAEKSEEEMRHWTAKQAYIALGNLLAACGELKVDACPIEGFEPDKYDEILGLSQQGLRATVVAAVGYRSEADPAQHAPKVRLPVAALFEVR